MDEEKRWTDETENWLQDWLADSREDCGCGCGHHAGKVLAALADRRLLLPPEAIVRVERGEVYQDGHRLGLEAIRTVWETAWTPAPLPEWERELLERGP